MGMPGEVPLPALVSTPHSPTLSVNFVCKTALLSAVFDYCYTTPDGQVQNKLVFLNW